MYMAGTSYTGVKEHSDPSPPKCVVRDIVNRMVKYALANVVHNNYALGWHVAYPLGSVEALAPAVVALSVSRWEICKKLRKCVCVCVPGD